MENERIGVAGFNGSQDCKAIVSLTDGGGIEIEINSKMKQMFGEAMRNSIMEELAINGVDNAHIIIEDQGSLDFVIRARVKTAIDRARRN